MTAIASGMRRRAAHVARTGNIVALPMGGKNAFALADQAAWIGRDLPGRQIRYSANFWLCCTGKTSRRAADRQTAAWTLERLDLHGGATLPWDHSTVRFQKPDERTKFLAWVKSFLVQPCRSEQAVTKFKPLLRKENTRRLGQITARIGKLLARLTRPEGAHDFKEAGYASQR